jgi:hypothetical protein
VIPVASVGCSACTEASYASQLLCRRRSFCASDMYSCTVVRLAPGSAPQQVARARYHSPGLPAPCKIARRTARATWHRLRYRGGAGKPDWLVSAEAPARARAALVTCRRPWVCAARSHPRLQHKQGPVRSPAHLRWQRSKDTLCRRSKSYANLSGVAHGPPTNGDAVQSSCGTETST